MDTLHCVISAESLVVYDVLIRGKFKLDITVLAFQT